MSSDQELMDYQIGGYCAEGESLVSTEECVAEESSEQSGEVGGAIEDIDDVCSSNAAQIEHGC